jgi:hypothetical protein
LSATGLYFRFAAKVETCSRWVSIESTGTKRERNKGLDKEVVNNEVSDKEGDKEVVSEE